MNSSHTRPGYLSSDPELEYIICILVPAPVLWTCEYGHNDKSCPLYVKNSHGGSQNGPPPTFFLYITSIQGQDANEGTLSIVYRKNFDHSPISVFFDL